MRVWAFCVLVAFSLIELYQWLHTLKLPLSVYGMAGLLLAFASNTDQWADFLLKRSASSAIPPQGIPTSTLAPTDIPFTDTVTDAVTDAVTDTAPECPAAMPPSVPFPIELAATEEPAAAMPPRIKAALQLPKLSPLPPSPSFTLR